MDSFNYFIWLTHEYLQFQNQTLYNKFYIELLRQGNDLLSKMKQILLI